MNPSQNLLRPNVAVGFLNTVKHWINKVPWLNLAYQTTEKKKAVAICQWKDLFSTSYILDSVLLNYTFQDHIA